MRFHENKNLTVLVAMAVVLLILIGGGLGYVGWTIIQAQPVAVEPTVVGAVAVQETVEMVAVPTVDLPAPTVIEMPALSTPPPATLVPEPTLQFGTVSRQDNCILYSTIVTLALGEAFDLTIGTTEYDSVEAMLDGMASGDIDFTLCFSDPTDRPLIRDRLGKIRQIGTTYWVGEGGKLQVWANGTSKADLRDELPCALSFLEIVSFTELNVEETTGEAWVDAHADQIDDWMQCN